MRAIKLSLTPDRLEHLCAVRRAHAPWPTLYRLCVRCASAIQQMEIDSMTAAVAAADSVGGDLQQLLLLVLCLQAFNISLILLEF